MIELVQALFAGRWLAVWQRNLRVWVKLFWPAMLGNFGEPLLYLLALGYGLGFFIGQVDDLPYLAFLASGIVCASAMQSASFEGMYSAYTRMAVQHTWQGMLASPLEIEDIVLGEAIWAGSKSLFSTLPILVVAGFMDALRGGWEILWVIPIVLLVGICFGGLALVMTALARNYDFFLYYTTLLITPMLLLSGVFFPLHSLPPAVQQAMHLLPLAHAVELVRPLMVALPLHQPLINLLTLLFYALLGLSVATALLKKRLSR